MTEKLRYFEFAAVRSSDLFKSELAETGRPRQDAIPINQEQVFQMFCIPPEHPKAVSVASQYQQLVRRYIGKGMPADYESFFRHLYSKTKFMQEVRELVQALCVLSEQEAPKFYEPTETKFKIVSNQ